MVSPKKTFFAQNVWGVKKFWGVSLENHFMQSFTSPDRPQ